MKRTVSILLAVVSLALLTGACSRQTKVEEGLRAAMRRTAAEPRRYVYADNSSARRLTVQGVIEDDFRYKARVLVNGDPALDEVVSDDALADRFENPAALPLFLSGAVSPKGGNVVPAVGATSTSDTGGSDALQALQSRQWVLDPVGAPSVTGASDPKRQLGQDPVVDSLTVFQYVDTAIRDAYDVHIFNKEALDYKAKEDPFPPPKKGSGVKRYDLVAPFLPKPNQAGANQAVPSAANFRKLAVYVKDGKVIQILERIDVVARLKDMARIYGVKFPAGQSPAQQAEFAIGVVNVLRTGQGNEPIRIRTMSLDIRDLGTSERVTLPDGAISGNLSFLRGRGKAAATATPGSDPSATTATTSASASASTSTTAGG